MAQLSEKALQFFFHWKAAVVSTDGDCFDFFRAAARHTTDQFNSALADNVRGERRKPRALSNAKHGAALKTTHIVFRNYQLRGFITGYVWAGRNVGGRSRR